MHKKCLFSITAITCPVPKNGAFTEDVPADLNLAYLETYTYSCLEGYVTDNELVVVCQPDGKLSAPAPNCSGELTSLLIMYKENISAFVHIKQLPKVRINPYQ